MYIPLLTVARGHSPPHCENTQVLREAITEDDDDDEVIINLFRFICLYLYPYLLKTWHMKSCFFFFFFH